MMRSMDLPWGQSISSANRLRHRLYWRGFGPICKFAPGSPSLLRQLDQDLAQGALDAAQHRSARAEIERRVNEVLRLQEASIRVMVSLAEFRDECTGNHIRRTQNYVRLLAEYISKQERDRAFLTPEHIDQIAKAAPLHDIGKIAIPDHILLKPGRHTPEEFEIMKTHSIKGEGMLLRSQHELGEENLMLLYAAPPTTRCVRAVLTSALLIMLKQSMCCVKVGASISIPC